MNLKTRFLILACVLSTVGIILAAPSLPVTKVPVTPNTSFTGPTNDAHAVMGQWFTNIVTSKLEYRTHEFYDNTSGSGGGSSGHLAIYGYVTNIVYDETSPLDPHRISSFYVVTTICNDTPATNEWSSGTNSHNEALSTSAQYTNTLRRVILTADFAIYGQNMENFDGFGYPYRNSFGSTYIKTTGHDYEGWYCWNPNDPSHEIHGNFSVPGWDFGDIAPEQTSTKWLHFVVCDPYGGVGASFIGSDDPRYKAIVSSTNGSDIFINRSLSLKISEWISDPALDEGDGAATNSNVSVFHDTDEDIHQVVSIASVKTQPSPLSITLYTTGSTNGISQQIMQVSTNLTTNTWWMSVATNEAAWPIPQTNVWSYTNTVWPVQFYRIIQP